MRACLHCNSPLLLPHLLPPLSVPLPVGDSASVAPSGSIQTFSAGLRCRYKCERIVPASVPVQAHALPAILGMEEPKEFIPDSGAVFTFGQTNVTANLPSKFWFKKDVPVCISCGDEHTALVTGHNKLYVFGSNSWGQLGLGSKSSVCKPTCVKALKSEKVKFAACGRDHTLVATEGGNVYSTGGNNEGQLGLGDTEERNTFCVITFFTSQHKIKQLSAGSSTSAALTENGELFMWGDNSEGQIGLDKLSNVCVPHQVTIGKPITWISCGYYHSAFVTTEGELYTFGETDGGKLGHPLGQLINYRIPQLVHGISEKVIQVACGGGHTVVLTEKAVYTFGLGQFGQLGIGTFTFETSKPIALESVKDKKVCHVACGENHTALLTDRGQLYTFGDGRHGKLGLDLEKFTNQFIPTLCSKFFNFVIHLVACGGCHMVVFAIPRHNMPQEYGIDERQDSYLPPLAVPMDDMASGNKMTKGKQTVSSSIAESENLGETTDVLNMTHVMSLKSRYKSDNLSPIEKQKKQEVEKHATHTGSSDSDEDEFEEMAKRMKEGGYKQLLPEGMLTMQTTVTSETFSDQDVGKGSSQSRPHANANPESLFKEIFKYDNEFGDDYQHDGEEIEQENCGGHNQKPSEDETNFEQEIELNGMKSLEDVRNVTISSMDTWFEVLENTDVDIEDDSKAQKCDVKFDIGSECTEQDSNVESDLESQQGIDDGLEPIECIDHSSEEQEVYDLENESPLSYSRKCLEQGNEDIEHRMATCMTNPNYQCDQLSEYQQGAEESAIEETERKENEVLEGKVKEDASKLSDDLTDRTEVSEGKKKSGGKAENIPNGEGGRIYKGTKSGAEKKLNGKREEGEEEHKEVVINEIGSLDERGKDLEKKKWEKRGKEEGHQKEKMEKEEMEEQGQGRGEEGGEKESEEQGEGGKDEESEEQGAGERVAKRDEELGAEDEGEGEEREAEGEGEEKMEKY
ncbi:X-linked retinitis pigmentosa GTPase regulator [Rhynchocyon petersi]